MPMSVPRNFLYYFAKCFKKYKTLSHGKISRSFENIQRYKSLDKGSRSFIVFENVPKLRKRGEISSDIDPNDSFFEGLDMKKHTGAGDSFFAKQNFKSGRNTELLRDPSIDNYEGKIIFLIILKIHI